MNWENLVIQLGVAGAVLLVAYKLALVLIHKWSEGDKARTEAHTVSERDRTAAIAAGFAQIMAGHGSLLERAQSIERGIDRLDVKVSTAMDLTPVRGVRQLPDEDRAASDPDQKPETKKRDTSPTGVKIPRSVTSG